MDLTAAGPLGKYAQQYADMMERASGRLPGALEERDTAQAAYQEQLNQPTNTMPSDIEMFGKMTQGFFAGPDLGTGLAKALQAYGQTTGAQDLEARKQAELAARQRSLDAYGDVNQNLKEMQIFSGGLKGLIGGKAGNADERIISQTNQAMNAIAKRVSERFPGMPEDQVEQNARKIFANRYNVSDDEISALLLTGRVPPSLKAVFGEGAPSAPTSPQREVGAPKFDPLNFSLEVPKGSNVNVAQLTQKMQANQAILRDPNQSAEAKQVSEKILQDMYSQFGVANPQGAQPVAQKAPPVTKSAVPQQQAQDYATAFSPWTSQLPKFDEKNTVGKNLELADKQLAEATSGASWQKQEQAGNAYRELGGALNNALNIDMKTDKLSGVKSFANAWSRALGMPLTDLAGKEITTYAQLEQLAASGGLAKQLEQAGVQTDKDFDRNIMTIFNPNEDRATRNAKLQLELERLNKRLGRFEFSKEVLFSDRGRGNVGNIDTAYRKMVNETGLPESIAIKTGGKYQYLPINQAIEKFQSTSVGSKYKFASGDTPEQRQEKIAGTVDALKKMHEQSVQWLNRPVK